MTMLKLFLWYVLFSSSSGVSKIHDFTLWKSRTSERSAVISTDMRTQDSVSYVPSSPWFNLCFILKLLP